MIASLTPILQAFCWILPLGFHFVVIGVVNNAGEDFSLRPLCSFLVFCGFFFGSAFPSVTIREIKAHCNFPRLLPAESGQEPFPLLAFSTVWTLGDSVFFFAPLCDFSLFAPSNQCRDQRHGSFAAFFFVVDCIVCQETRSETLHLLPDIFSWFGRFGEFRRFSCCFAFPNLVVCQ